MFSSQNSQVSNDANYIEDVFSTYLYTGNGSTQTITNGIDLAGDGGLTWIKARGANGQSHNLFDTARGATNYLITNSTGAQNSFGVITDNLTSFNANGFSLGGNSQVNFNNDPFASWTFRKQPKFFDVVTYTGNGANNRVINHNLGSTPACIMVKRTDSSGNWHVYHRSLGVDSGAPTLALSLLLNTTGQALDYRTFANSTYQTDTTFKLGNSNIDDVNGSGFTYVAYLFAHDAGGFGLTGTDNVISCGTFTDSAIVSLGYEPQWIMVKRTNTASDWVMVDTMRGLTANFSGSAAGDAELFANLSSAELAPPNGDIGINSTGFRWNGSAGTYIYIAIRRGPMKVPTSGTSVFVPMTYAGSGSSGRVFSLGMQSDLTMITDRNRDGFNNTPYLFDRLRGGSKGLSTNSTMAEFSEDGIQEFRNTSIQLSTAGVGFNNSTYMNDGLLWNFRRAPNFFDEVCYTGTGSARTVTHNLGAVPELMIMKNRSTTGGWYTYAASLGASNALQLNLSDAALGFGYWNNTAPTASVFSTGAGSNNDSGVTYVAYLFATCAGVQYINSYVGDGTTGRTINCGFTGGARFVCIKAKSTSGSWWTFDSARGIVTNNDPALQLNSTAAEVTSADAIDTAASGFIVNQEATCSLNASGVSYLVWAIA